MGSLRLVRVETSGSGEWGHNVSDKYRPDGGDWERMYCTLETEGEEVLGERNEKQSDDWDTIEERADRDTVCA